MEQAGSKSYMNLGMAAQTRRVGAREDWKGRKEPSMWVSKYQAENSWLSRDIERIPKKNLVCVKRKSKKDPPLRGG